MKRLVNILMVVIFAAALLPAGGAALAQEAAPAVPCTPLTGEEQSALLQPVQQEAAGQLDAAGEETLRRLREQANCFVMQPAPVAPDMVASPDAPAAPAAAPDMIASGDATASPDAPDATVTFAIIGDYGMDDTNETNVANLVKGWTPNFIIATGDDFYNAAIDSGDTGNKYHESTGKYYCDYLKDIAGTTGCTAGNATVNKFFPVLGNHDYSDATPAPSTYTNYFTLPGTGFTNSSGSELYYDFVWGNIHFFMLDGNRAYGSYGADLATQQAWLQTQLPVSNSTWNIVVVHEPPYSSDASHGSTAALQWNYAGWGADAVISGHAHDYERIIANGIPYFVNGIGGAARYAKGTKVAGSQSWYGSESTYWGAQKVIATDDSLTFQFYTTDGTLRDSYQLITQNSCTTVTASTAASGDDAEECRSGCVSPQVVGSSYIDSSDLEFQYDSGTNYRRQMVGMRFPGLAVPQGSAIQNAYVTWQAKAADSTLVNVSLHAEAANSAAIYTGARDDISGRTDTANGVLWSEVPSWTANTSYQSTDLAVLVQEVVDRTGWASGNAMNIMLEGTSTTSTNKREPFSWDDTTGAAPSLTVTYCTAPTGIGDFVWDDADGDGVQDGGEAGHAGVTVNLRNGSNNNLVASTTTGAGGSYSFSSVATGSYYVEFVAPSGYGFALQDQGGDDAKDSDASPSTGQTATFSFTSGTPQLTWDAGLLPLVIGDKVWNDIDKDGVQDSGEAGLSGVIVRLFTSAGAQVAVTYTDSSGNYRFSSPASGNYYVQFELPGGYTYSPKYYHGSTSSPTQYGDDSDVNMATGYTDVFSWTAGGKTVRIDAGMWAIGTKDIGDEVWFDTDGDGVQDALGTTEFPGGPVTVKLMAAGPDSSFYTADDVVVQNTVSTRSLSYGFSGIANGTYYIQFVAPAGYDFTGRYATGATEPFGTNGKGDDSDANELGQTDVFTYSGAQVLAIDAGLKNGPTCYVVADNTTEGSDQDDTLVRVDLLTGKGYYIGQATTQPGTGGVEGGTLAYVGGEWRVYSYNTNVWGYLLASTGAWTTLGSAITSGCTDQNGNTRTVVSAEGFDAIAYNPFNETWWAAERQTGTTLDVLVQINPATGAIITDSAYFPGSATCASIAAPAGNTSLTDIDDMAFSSDGTLYIIANNGEAEARITVPTVAGGEYTGAVTDLGTIARLDNGTNVNDVEGFSIDSTGRAFISTGGWNISSNPDHDSVFEIMNLGGGTKLLATPVTGFLNGAGALIGSNGASASDYEAIACYGSTSSAPPTRSSIGNYVWFDTDGDGIQETGEIGIAGVVVELYGRGMDGVFGTADDVLLRTTTTATDGSYLFSSLPAGPYQVRLAASNYESGGALSNYVQTTNPVNPNADGGNQTLSYTVVLPWSTNNMTADFGFGRADLGDHLDGNFKTLVASNGPRHVVFPDPGNDGTPAAWGGVEAVWLGPTVDTEGNGQPSTAANGDDLAATDDEDGAAINSMTWSGLNLQLPVTVSSSGAPTGMYLAAWVDWNADGVFNSTGYYDANTCPACEMYKVAVSVGSNTLSLAAPSTFQNYDPSLEIRLRLYASDPGTPSPVGLVVNGEVEDYVRGVSPTGITLAAMSASVQGDAIEVTWDTASEVSNLGFNLYRRLSPDGPEIRLNANQIPAQGSGSPQGFHYTYLDSAGLVPGATYWYTLEDVSSAGVATRHEPVSVVYSGGPTAVSLSGFAGSRGIAPAAFAALAALAALAGLVLASAAVRRRGAPR